LADLADTAVGRHSRHGSAASLADAGLVLGLGQGVGCEVVVVGQK